MCGICGFVGREDAELGTRMADTLAHRGPDGEGVRGFAASGSLPPATLAHRRLSIIDPTARGAQPMSYGRYHITYNGELYNFRELRRELERSGSSFVTETDTEVLLALYARDGAAMLDRLNGMFAFAIWDDERHELFLARDRLGIKPLYYASEDGVFYFASEPKALLEALRPPTMRLESLANFLTFLWVPDPDTLFEGVHKLPPGHLGLYRDGRLELREWWDLEFSPEERPEAEWIDDVRETVQRSITRQMVSDVPLGAFLSGGIDSSAIVAGMSSSGRVTAYSIGSPERDHAHEVTGDDIPYARMMADAFPVDYHEQIVEADVLELLPRLIRYLDDPVADTATITTFLICSAAREKLTVILSGMGGDEIFAGYPRHLAMRLSHGADAIPRRLRRNLRELAERRVAAGGQGRSFAPRRNLRKLLNGFDLPFHERYLAYCSYYHRAELDRLLSPDVRAALRDHDPWQHHRRYFERVAGEHWLNQILYLDAKTFLPCLNLAYTDKLSMAASTEVRVPLLDDELVALAARIPPRLKLRRTTRKYVFKRSMEGVLPKEIIWRPKSGFGGSTRAWVKELRPLLEDVLSPERVSARGLFDPAAIAKLLDDQNAGREDNALRLWTLLTFELWSQEHLARTGALA